MDSEKQNTEFRDIIGPLKKARLFIVLFTLVCVITPFAHNYLTYDESQTFEEPQSLYEHVYFVTDPTGDKFLISALHERLTTKNLTDNNAYRHNSNIHYNTITLNHTDHVPPTEMLSLKATDIMSNRPLMYEQKDFIYHLETRETSTEHISSPSKILPLRQVIAFGLIGFILACIATLIFFEVKQILRTKTTN